MRSIWGKKSGHSSHFLYRNTFTGISDGGCGSDSNNLLTKEDEIEGVYMSVRQLAAHRQIHRAVQLKINVPNYVRTSYLSEIAVQHSLLAAVQRLPSMLLELQVCTLGVSGCL